MAQQGRQPVGPDGLTIKQRKWLRIYLSTGNATEAAMQVYDCKDRNSAHVVGCQNLQKLTGRLGEAMEAAGITVALLLQKLQEGLDATTVETASYQGKILDEKVRTDYPTRHRYLDTAAKLRGDYAPTKQELSGPDGGPMRHFFEMSDDDLDALIDE